MGGDGVGVMGSGPLSAQLRRADRPRHPLRRSEVRAGARLVEEAALEVLALLADVERRDGAVVAHHARPHLAALALVVGQRDRRFGDAADVGHVVHLVPPVGMAGVDPAFALFVRLASPLTRRACAASPRAAPRRTSGRTRARPRGTRGAGRSRTSA